MNLRDSSTFTARSAEMLAIAWAGSAEIQPGASRAFPIPLPMFDLVRRRPRCGDSCLASCSHWLQRRRPLMPSSVPAACRSAPAPDRYLGRGGRPGPINGRSTPPRHRRGQTRCRRPTRKSYRRYPALRRPLRDLPRHGQGRGLSLSDRERRISASTATGERWGRG